MCGTVINALHNAIQRMLGRHTELFRFYIGFQGFINAPLHHQSWNVGLADLVFIVQDLLIGIPLKRLYALMIKLIGTNPLMLRNLLL